MANSNSNIYDIQLQGANLNLNKFDSNIKQFTGFNKLNAPFFGDKLSPMWKKERTAETNGSVFDNDGNEYYFTLPEGTTTKILTKKDLSGNETQLLEVEKEGFEETIIQSKYDILAVSTIENDNGFSVDDYIFVKFNKIWIKFDGVEYNTNITYLDDAALCKIYEVNDKKLFCGITQRYIILIYDGIATQKDLTNDRYSLYSIWKVDFLNEIWFSTGSSSASVYKLTLNGLLTAANIGYRYTIESYNLYGGLFGSYTEGGVTYKIGSLFYEGVFYPLIQVLVDNDYVWKPKFIVITEKVNEQDFTVVKIRATLGASVENPLDFDYLVLNEYGRSVTNFTDLASEYKYEGNSLTIKEVFYYYTDGESRNAFLYIKNERVYSFVSFYDDNNKPGINWGMLDNIPINNLEEWRILYNNEHISGISYGLWAASNAATGRIGTLLTEWNSINEDFKIQYSTDKILYKDNNSKLHIISKKINTELKIYENCLYMNTISEINCFNLNNLKAFNFCNDWNNRVYDGYPLMPSSNSLGRFYFTSGTPLDKTTYDSLKNASYINHYITAINANYEITKNPFSSILLNPVVCYRFKALVNVVQKNKSMPLCAERCETLLALVDCYIADSAGIPVYFISYTNTSNSGKKTELEGVQYPVDTSGNVLYNFPFFFKLIKSYVNKDFAVINGNGYPLIYYNNEVQFKYYFLSMFENLDAAFVINGQTYCVSNNLVFSCTYQNGVISNIQSVVNVSNMKYLGCDTHRAYFWADMNKTVYAFSGANTLEMAFTADSINQVLFTGYNPTTNNIYVATDSGVYIFGQNGSYKISDSVVKQAYAWKKGMILQNGVNALYSFTKLEGFTKQNIELATEFYGLSSHQKSVNDCIYLRLFDEDLSKGEVSLKVESLTDGARETEETVIKINNSDWDKLTKSVYVRYQPKRQRALGTCIHIKSPFAIGYMGIGNIADAKVIDSVSKTSINKPSVSAAKYNF